MLSGIDPNALEMSEFKGELLGLVADMFDDLENRLAQSRNSFINTWNEAAFHHRGDDGAPPAIPLAATSLTEAGVDARVPASGNESVTNENKAATIASGGNESGGGNVTNVSVTGPATCPSKQLANSNCSTIKKASRVPSKCSATSVTDTTSHVSFSIQQGEKLGSDLSIRGSLVSEQTGGNSMSRQTTKELINDLHDRTALVGQFLSEEDKQATFDKRKEEQTLRATKKWAAKDYVTSAKFDLASASIIIMNAVVMGFEVQSRSYDDGYALGYPGQSMPSAEAWPGADKVFYVLEFAFGLAFTVELLIKLCVLRWEFCKMRWNMVDVIVVACWFVTLISESYMPFNPTLFRLLRILKLIRLAKMFKTIEIFDSLQVLVGSIRACFSALVWSSFLLVLITTLFAFLFNTLLNSFVLDENQADADRFEVYELFGSFSNAMMSMAELTLGNWVPICRVLYGKVAQTYGYIVLVYVILVNFAVVRVITGVFLQTTFSVAAMDDDLVVVQKLRAAASHRTKMMRLLLETDVESKGYIEKDDFRYALQNSKLKQWLSAMDLEVNDPDLVFDFLDNGDGKLDYDELIQGVSRLKGVARSIDVILINRRTLQLGYLCKKIIKRLDGLACAETSQEATKKRVCTALRM